MISWYVVHTRNQLQIKHLLDKSEGIVETFLPITHRRHQPAGGLKARAIVMTYLFVRGRLGDIKAALKDIDGVELEMTALRDAGIPMCIDDEDMHRFMTFSEHHLELERLRNPYRSFNNNDRARILSGPFAGYEGFIKEIKRDLKLIVRVGNWAVAVANIQKYDLVIISNDGTRESEAARIARLHDYFGVRLRAFSTDSDTDTNPFAVLRHLVADFHKYGTATNILERTEKKLNRQPLTGTEQTARHYLNHLVSSKSGFADESRLKQMSQYIYSKEPDALLEHILPDMPLRPFLTPQPEEQIHTVRIKQQNQDTETTIIRKHKDFDEHIIPIIIDEGLYDSESDTIKKERRHYLAHVAVTKNPDGTYKVFTNWHHFYQQYLWQTDDSKSQLIDKLDRYGMDNFRSVLSQDTTIRFMEHPTLKIYGLSTTADTEEDIQSSIDKLITEGKEIIDEIMTSTRLRPWQKHLCRVWIRC